MPADPVLIKTIVTTDMAERIAAHYGVRTVNVLTGFKFIGEQIGRLEAQGRLNSYVFGFEESYGYLSGPYVRDKDGVGAACLICEMFSYYAARGVSLLDRLEQLYADYGYCLNTLHSYTYDGSAGFARMQAVMQGLRGGVASFGSRRVLRVLDYAGGLDGLPKSDVLKFILEGGCTLVVRPSGTEPKAEALSLRQRAEPGGGARSGGGAAAKRRGAAWLRRLTLSPEGPYGAFRRFCVPGKGPLAPESAHFRVVVQFLRYINRISG